LLVLGDVTELSPCGSGVVSLITVIARAAAEAKPSSAEEYLWLLKRSADLLRLARQKLHAYPYKDVPPCWRCLFTDASILKAVLLIRPDSPAEEEEEEIVYALDMAVIMAGAPGRERKKAIERMLVALDSDSDSDAPARKRLKVGSIRELAFDATVDTVAISYPVPRFPSEPSLSGFLQHLNTVNTPIVIPSIISRWPALRDHPWNSPSYLLSRTNKGQRLVPVEVGRAYTDADWGQQIITFGKFLERYMLTTREKDTGYLAQHSLFSQIPQLREDIHIPDFCYVKAPKPPGNVQTTSPLEEPLLNAWFGPRGTVSPLHTDPYANILAQVVGSKYIRLYSPAETKRVFPRGMENGGVDMSNTSRAEVEADGGGKGLSKEEQGVWRKAEYVECVLRAGECLYIPAGWWHYVRGLETSFSVSFWWN